MDNFNNNINHYNPNRIRKMLIVFDGMIADINICKKLNVSFAFITQPYFSVFKEVRLNSTHYLIMKIHNKRELRTLLIIQQIYKKCTSKPYSFLTTSLPANDPLRFRKNLLDSL